MSEPMVHVSRAVELMAEAVNREQTGSPSTIWNEAIRAAADRVLRHPCRVAGQTEDMVRESLSKGVLGLLRPEPSLRWADMVLRETERLGRAPTLAELLTLCRGYRMTPEEAAAQRWSFVVGEAGFGSDADERAYREAIAREDVLEIQRLEHEAIRRMEIVARD